MCKRITTGGRSYIEHDPRCPGRFTEELCELIAEEIEALLHPCDTYEHHEHHHHHHKD